MKRAILLFPLLGPAVGAAQPLKDPFRPPQAIIQAQSSAESVVPVRPVVRVLVISKDQRHAVIDGVVLKQGDTFDQWRIMQISPKGVRLQINGAEELMSISPRVTITPSKAKP